MVHGMLTYTQALSALVNIGFAHHQCKKEYEWMDDSRAQCVAVAGK